MRVVRTGHHVDIGRYSWRRQSSVAIPVTAVVRDAGSSARLGQSAADCGTTPDAVDAALRAPTAWPSGRRMAGAASCREASLADERTVFTLAISDECTDSLLTQPCWTTLFPAL